MSSNASTTQANAVDVLEERLIDAEYKIWKKNTPYLYDFVMTHSLQWPSLTCQWWPKVVNLADKATEHYLLLGTHTTGEQNYLMVASCTLPKSDTVLPVETPEEAAGTTSKPAASASGGSSKATAAVTAAPKYDESKNELGGFGLAHSTIGKIEIRRKVKHEGEVNRARYMPQNHFVVASRGPNPEVFIFDLSKHESFPPENSPFSPQGVCVGHEKEGYGMVWSKHKEGHLVTCSGDATVKLWDVSSSLQRKSEPGTLIKPLSNLAVHSDSVEDVDWNPFDAHLVGSVGVDQLLGLWDLRDTTKPVERVTKAHEGDINCIAFNLVNEYVIATGSSDKTIAIWDMRNLKQRVQTLVGHSDQVYMIQWAPFNESILGSCSSDRRVAIWDLSRIGMEQSAEDAEDGPPELLFLHGGHTSKVSDFAWNVNDQWTIASVAEDNVLQVWNMAEEVYAQDEEDEDEEKNGGGALGDDELEGK